MEETSPVVVEVIEEIKALTEPDVPVPLQGDDDVQAEIQRAKGRFVKGDPRINRAGREKGYHADPIKRLGLDIAARNLNLSKAQRRRYRQKGVELPREITIIEELLLDLATSKNVSKQDLYLNRTFGTLTQKTVNANFNFDFTAYIDRYTDAELEQIREGADPLKLLLDKIPPADTD